MLIYVIVLILLFVPFHCIYLFFVLLHLNLCWNIFNHKIKLVWPDYMKLCISWCEYTTHISFQDTQHLLDCLNHWLACVVSVGRHEKNTFSMHGRLDFLGSKYRYLSKWPTIKTCKSLQFLIFYQRSQFIIHIFQPITFWSTVAGMKKSFHFQYLRVQFQQWSLH